VNVAPELFGRMMLGNTDDVGWQHVGRAFEQDVAARE